MQFRGIHVEARGKRSVPGLERLLSEIAPALGFNYVIAEVNTGFEFSRHPEISSPDPLPAQEARRLASLAESNGIQLVPMFNCLGHQSWGSRIGGLLVAHPEFNESPDVDPKSERFYCYSWCPNHPEVNPIVFDAFDELLDAFQADTFHVGMDEVFILGQCPRCKGSSAAELFAQATNDYYNHLAERRGVKVMMWGDRLLPRRLGFAHWDAAENGTEGAADLIPKDIIVCDWHYHLTEDYPSVKYFLDTAFFVCTSGWKEPPAIRRIIKVSRREANDRMLGYLATTWCGVSQFVKAYLEPEREPEVAYLPDVVNGVKLGAALAWD